MSGGHGRALELSGWAERDEVAAECVILVDGAGTAIGAGAFVTRRPDVEQAAARSLGLVGWKGVAAVPASAPVCALALFPGESELVPLADCQAIHPRRRCGALAQPRQALAGGVQGTNI
jgi:hypothetical protein